jgi:hypothetical protein
MLLCGCAGSLLIVGTVAAAPDRPSGQAIQFGIGWILTLESFQDATLAYQRFIGRDVAWRASLGLDLDYRDGEYSVDYEAENPVDHTKDKIEWDHTVGVVSEWLWYRGANVSVFFGGGPRVSYASHQDEYWSYSSYEEAWTHERTWNREFGGGLQGCLGVQWVAVEWLTIHAEYDARAMYIHRVSELKRASAADDPPARTATTTVDGLSFDSQGVRFGLSVYF